VSFADDMTLLLKFEGGYTVDSGGPTNYGVTQSTYNDWRFKSVKDITMDEVYAIYNQMYWLAAGCDKLDALSPALGAIHFDCAVNCGVGTAVRMLQEICSASPEDGVFGQETYKAVQLKLGIPIESDPVAIAYLTRRKMYYQSLNTFNQYGSSWLHRLDDLAKQFGLTWTSATSTTSS
jgi:lysozyme family protein